MLYRNISPFCEPLSFDIPYKFFYCIFVQISIRIFCVLYELLLCIFIRISTVFSYEFLLCLYEVSLLILDLISIWIFLLFLQQIDYCTLLISYEFYTAFYTNFYCIYTNFLLSFVTNRLPYILYCFVFVHEFWMLYPWNNESDCITCIIQIFWCKAHLTMSMIVLFSPFSPTCAFTVLETLYSHTLLILPPTTVLCIFFK